MTPKQLAIASLHVLKILRRRPMPYKWTQLQKESPYTADQLRQMLLWLRGKQYIKEIGFVDVVITEKGKQARSYYGQQLETWYNNLPAFFRRLLSPVTAAVVTGICLIYLLHTLEDLTVPEPPKLDWSTIYSYGDSVKTATAERK